jgi:hypothetical protein
MPPGVLFNLTRRVNGGLAQPLSYPCDRTAIPKLSTACWSQQTRPVGPEAAAQPLLPGAVPEKACTIISEIFRGLRKMFDWLY